jgi:hypothetical protein
MSHTIFDCSQFLTFDLVEKRVKKDDLIIFERIGFKVLLKEEISEKKQMYLDSFLQDELIELFDQEFIGVFEDWRTAENPPLELINLKREIAELCSKVNVNSLKLIIISCASESIEDDKIVEKSVHIDQFYEGLFLLSKWNFKEVADNLILTINP